MLQTGTAQVTPSAALEVRASGKPRPRRRIAKQDRVTRYAADVVDGKIVAGPHVRAACARHLRDLQHGASRGLKWDMDRALYYIAFFETFLCLNGGKFEGVPFELQPWQAFIVGSLYGWVHEATGLRRFTAGYCEIGKGNGKSPLAAGLGIAGLIIDGEPRAEIYAAATKKDQAMILFRDAVAMVNLSPALKGRIKPSGRGDKVWDLEYQPTGSFFRPISSEDNGQSGPRPHISLVDEFHEHKTASVVDMLEAGQKGREQPLIFIITNSGSDRTSPCYQHHEAAIAACNAKPGDKGFDDTLFAYVCALDEGDDWMRDRACWPKANPNLGVSIGTDYLERQVMKARNIPSRQNIIARLNFCVWTDAEQAWIGADAWLRAEVPNAISRLRGARAYLGIDLSQRRDLTAVAHFVPDDEGGGDAWVEIWTPGATLLAREDRDRVPYAQWVREGHLHSVPGESVDFRHVVRNLARGLADLELDVVDAAFDRWRIDEFRRALDAEELELPLHEFGQGFKDMSPALDRLENLILNGKLRIHANPVLRWNAASAVTEEDAAGNRKFTKRKATGRIDGIVALAMAVGVAELVKKDEKPDIDAFLRSFRKQ